MPVAPADAHGWAAVLGELARQLTDPGSRTSREPLAARYAACARQILDDVAGQC